MALKRRPPKNNVRRVKTNSKNVWGITTNPQNETIQFEFRMDKYPSPDFDEACLMLVKSVSQPIRITFTDYDDKERSYTPDFQVFLDSGEIEIHEFSMSSKRIETPIRQREAAAKSIL